MPQCRSWLGSDRRERPDFTSSPSSTDAPCDRWSDSDESDASPDHTPTWHDSQQMNFMREELPWTRYSIAVKNTFVEERDSKAAELSQVRRSLSCPADHRMTRAQSVSLGEATPAPRQPSQSLGSLLHNDGRCRPCAHNWKPNGCSKGADCNFCHLCDESAFALRRKCKMQLRRENERKRRARKESKGQNSGGNRHSLSSCISECVATK